MSASPFQNAVPTDATPLTDEDLQSMSASLLAMQGTERFEDEWVVIERTAAGVTINPKQDDLNVAGHILGTLASCFVTQLGATDG